MSLISHFPRLDDSYPTELCLALRSVRRFINNEGETYISGMLHLWRVLEDMKYDAPFRPAWKTNEPRPHVPPGSDYRYRRPVWDAIATEIDKQRATSLPISDSQAKKAEWLEEQLKLCTAHQKYQTALEHFRAELKEIGINLHVGICRTLLEPDVVLTGSFKARCEAAMKTVLSIADSLIATLNKLDRGKSSA